MDRYEETLKNSNRDMAITKMKSTFAVTVALLSLLGILNSSFDGKVIAKLPFEPFGFITGLSHRNLPGSDFTDCSVIFFYAICSASIRTNVQKLLGTAPPRTSQFGQPTPF